MAKHNTAQDRRERRPPVDVDAVAVYTGMTKAWWRRAVQERRVPFIKLGRLVRFDLDAVDRWLEENTVQPARDDLDELLGRRRRSGA